MAWNDPGNSPGKRNPWEKRPGKPASTGLDEMIKHFRKKFSASPGGGNVGVSVGIVLLVILVLLWFSTGLFQVEAGQVAVITRFGKFQRIEQAGRTLRLPWPIEDSQIVNTGEEQHNAQLRVLTNDETFLDVVFVVKYRRADAAAWVFNVRDPESVLTELGESAIREVFAHETLGMVLSANRQSFAMHARELMQDALDASKSGVRVSAVDVVDVRVPPEVKSAQDELTKAQAENAAVVAMAREYASSLGPAASGEAAVIRQNAEAYKSQRIAKATGDTEQFMKLLPEYQKAPAATREGLYIEMMESIYSNTRKIFVDGKGNTINVTVEKPASLLTHDASVDAKPASIASSSGKGGAK